MKQFNNVQKGEWSFSKIVAILVSLSCLAGIIISLVFLYDIGAFDDPSPPAWIIPMENEIAWTGEELKEVYWEYKEELDEAAEIVLASDPLRKRMLETNDNAFIRSLGYKEYFSDEDWEKVVDLFEKVRPYEMVRSLWDGDVVRINFSRRNVEGGYYWSSLHYIKHPEIVEYYKRKLYVGEGLEHLDGYWYVNDKFTETTQSETSPWLLKLFE